MKSWIVSILVLVCILGLVGCNNRTMDYIIENEPSIIGIVEEVHDNLITVYINTEDYPNEENCQVSLDAENKDSYTDVSVDDEVVIYYNGEIAESDPLQINTVYAITLKNQQIKVLNEIKKSITK